MFRRELELWLRLKHAAIVPLLGIANVDSPFPALVSQWMASGTLYMYFEQGTIALSSKVKLASPSLTSRSSILCHQAMGVANGLKYLHSKNVVHGDLHPANVLIDDSGNARLTDFGLATVAGGMELQLSASTVSRELDSRWGAPEVIRIEDDRCPERPNFKSDIYSFGSIMFFVRSLYLLQLYPKCFSLRSSQGMYHGKRRNPLKSVSHCQREPYMRVPTTSLTIIGT
ncbi:kinase-like domain-containing protein [Suillus paluster]|uniref:kinase-like domain-containing protein n=1 Tax=Suillus paluster TaxID=48578 RepID=UPI001B8718C8|nr:kinase-like domain-containing protein [Suillus paluster]KAG1731477.1 kinase-like domain-containing protein [Suillus paluster]